MRVELNSGENITQLRDRIRTLPPDVRRRGVKVVVPPGRYVFSESLILDERDSGSPDCPVVWCSKDLRDRPIFVSGIELKKNAFKKVTDPLLLARLDVSVQGKAVEVDLSPYGFVMPIGTNINYEVGGPLKVPSVSVDGKCVRLANYPDEGWCEIAEIIDKGTVTGAYSVKQARERGMIGTNEVVRGGTFRYREDRPSFWNNPVLIECFWAFDWRATIIWTKTIDPLAKTMTMKSHHQFGIKSGNPRPRRWRALNVFEELNEPGRYVIDPETKKMFLYPPNEDFETVLVSGKPCATVKIDRAHDIVFSGIDFGESCGSGVELTGASRVTIENAHFRHQRDWAVYGTNVWDCTLRTCDVTQVGNGCFCIWGGDRRKLVPGNNLVEDCLFEDWGTQRSSCGYAIEFHGVGNNALHNEIRNANGYVVTYKQNNGLFAYNVISNTTWGVDDAGAFYKGLNPSMRGNRIEYNYWRDIGGTGGHGSCAIYFDDGDSGDFVFGNIFENCGRSQFHYSNFGAVFSHGGCSNIVRNSLFVKCDRSLGGWGWKQEKWETAIKGRNSVRWQNYDYKFLKDVDCRSPEWRRAYPELETFLDPYPNEIRKNAAYDCVAIDCPAELRYPQKNGAVVRKGGYVAGHWHTNDTFAVIEGDPGFVDYAQRDYRLKVDSEVYRCLPNFKPIPFEKIGLMHKR
ncbi:MAG: right-handed parallel beta-helix repeat-containing protein [Kiritimatiellae bacterium]|nr:right-handed parallel beta-helix repeat-containing protein [Kiritimatiellia bacterium]